MFTHDDNGDKKKERKRCDGVYGLDVLMSFSFIWDDYVVVDIVGRLTYCVARKLPSEERPVEILLWSGRMKNREANKWEGGRFVF
jgi:hypothetical protein